MKNRRGTILILALLAFLLGWWLWPRREAVDTSVPTAVTASQSTNASGSGVRPSLPPPELIPDIIRSVTGERQRQRERDIESARDEWRAPIDFYGLVVNEQNQPVADAVIELSWNNLSGTFQETTATDVVGRFSLDGKQGKHLSVKASKPGYYSSKSNRVSFFYAGRNDNFVPDANQPVVLHLRKQGEAEPLMRFNKSFVVPKDGVPIFVDLATGNLTTSAGATFEVECRTQAPVSRGAKYNWKCRIKVPGGGLQITDEEFAFEAPLEGYRAFDLIDMTVANVERWQSDVSRTYFIHTADGRYGRLTFRMIAGGDHFCRVESYLNPSGSRNLEYSEAAQDQMEPR